MKNRRLISMTMAAVMVGGLAACGSSGSAAATTAAATTAAATEAATTAAATEAAKETTAGATEAAGAEGGSFIVGFDQEFPPMGFVGDDGQYTGFDLDLAKGGCTPTFLNLCAAADQLGC